MSTLASLTRNLNGVAAGGLRGNFNAMCSSAPSKSILNDTGFSVAYSGNNVSQHQTAASTVGSHNAATQNINITAQVCEDANHYVAQVQDHLNNLVEVIEMAAEEAGVQMCQAFPTSDMGNSGAMALNAMTAGTGLDAACMITDLVEGVKEGSIKPSELQDQIATKLRSMASRNPDTLTSSERQTQQIAGTIVKAMENGHGLKEIVEAANDPSKLPEVRAAQQTAYQSDKVCESNSNVKEETAHKANLAAHEERALGQAVIKEADCLGLDVKELANTTSADVELTGASVSGVTKCILPGDLSKQFKQACDNTSNPVRELQARLQEAFAANNISPPETASPIGSGMGMIG